LPIEVQQTQVRQIVKTQLEKAVNVRVQR
jgi:hypothetical protein